MIQQLQTLQDQIGEWSQQNFGQQESSIHGTLLHEIAPFLGLMEEIGEYEDATTVADMVDGIADTGIYLMDYLSRSNVKVSELDYSDNAKSKAILETLPAILGKMAHFLLKAHQGIRGVTPQQWRRETCHWAAVLLYALDNEIRTMGSPSTTEPLYCITTAIQDTWDKIVSKRNWVSNSQSG